MMEPHVHAHEFTADCLSDFGFEIVDHAKALKEALQRLCVKHEGRRNHDRIHLPRQGEEKIDPGRWEHVRQIGIGGTSDNLQCCFIQLTQIDMVCVCGVGGSLG